MVREIADDFGFSRARSKDSAPANAATEKKEAVYALKDVNERITELERKAYRDRGFSQREKDKLDELIAEREKQAERYTVANKFEKVASVEQNPDAYAEVNLDQRKDNAHVLQYQMGQMVLEKSCPKCNSPMQLQHKNIDKPDFTNFFWQCTRFYTLTSEQRELEKVQGKTCPPQPFVRMISLCFPKQMHQNYR